MSAWNLLEPLPSGVLLRTLFAPGTRWVTRGSKGSSREVS